MVLLGRWWQLLVSDPFRASHELRYPQGIIKPLFQKLAAPDIKQTPQTLHSMWLTHLVVDR